MAASISLYEQVENRSEALIRAHLPMVRRVAIHLKARLPPFMELDELVQVGVIGLIEAARAYDPGRGFEFEHFALSRIRGAILDEVRRLSALPRSAVAFIRQEDEARHVLGSELGRTPTQAELAAFMGKDVDDYQREREQARRFETCSMELVSEEVMSLPGAAAMQPEVIVEEAQFMEALVAEIDCLPERERLIMSLYYVEELNLKEIGAVLGVTESRVSQILTAVVRKLRQGLHVA